MIEPPPAGMSQRTVSENAIAARHLVAEDLPRRRPVHARGDELVADLRLAEPPERRAAQSPSRPAIESSGRRAADSASEPPLVSAT